MTTWQEISTDRYQRVQTEIARLDAVLREQVRESILTPTWRAVSHTGDGKIHDEHGSYEWVCPFNGQSFKPGTIHTARIYVHGTRKDWIERMAAEHMATHGS